MAGGRVSTNNFATADWIVDGSGIQNGATHTTIGGALAVAASGDTVFVRPGTYTENITLPVGVYLCGTAGGNLIGQTILNGKLTQTATGTSNVSNIRFTQNADVCVDIGGSGTIQTSFSNCSFFFDAATCLTLNNASATPTFWNCNFHQTGNSRAIFVVTTGSPQFFRCNMFNSGGTPGNSTIAAGGAALQYCSMQGHQYTTSSTGTLSLLFSSFSTEVENVTIVTTAGTGQSEIRECLLRSGTASAVSIGSGTTVNIQGCQINSTNTNPVTGAGTVLYDGILFSNTGRTINTTTKNSRYFATGAISFDDGVTYINSVSSIDYATGTWTPTILGSGSNPTTTGTYTGVYTRIGDVVHVKFNLVPTTWSGGSGSLQIGNLPFTSANNGRNVGSLFTSGVDWQAGSLTAITTIEPASAVVNLITLQDNGVSLGILVSGVSALSDLISGEITYWI